MRRARVLPAQSFPGTEEQVPWRAEAIHCLLLETASSFQCYATMNALSGFQSCREPATAWPGSCMRATRHGDAQVPFVRTRSCRRAICAAPASAPGAACSAATPASSAMCVLAPSFSSPVISPANLTGYVPEQTSFTCQMSGDQIADNIWHGLTGPIFLAGGGDG